MNPFLLNQGFCILVIVFGFSLVTLVSTRCPQEYQPCVELLKHKALCSSLENICSAIVNGNSSSLISSFSNSQCPNGSKFCPTSQRCHLQNASCDLDTRSNYYSNGSSIPWGGRCSLNRQFCAISMSCIPINTSCSLRKIYDWKKASNSNYGPYGALCPSGQTFCLATMGCNGTANSTCNLSTNATVFQSYCKDHKDSFCSRRGACITKGTSCTAFQALDWTNVTDPAKGWKELCEVRQSVCTRYTAAAAKCFPLISHCMDSNSTSVSCGINQTYCKSAGRCQSLDDVCCLSEEKYCNYTRKCVMLGKHCCPENHTFCNFTRRCHPPPEHCCPQNHTFCDHTQRCHMPEDHCCPVSHTFCNFTKNCISPAEHCCPKDHTFCDHTQRCHMPEDHCCPKNQTFCNFTKSCIGKDEMCCPVGHGFCNFTKRCEPTAKPCCPRNHTFCNSTGACHKPGEICCPLGQVYCKTALKCQKKGDVCCLVSQKFCNTTKKCHEPGEICCPANEPNCFEEQLYKTAYEFEELEDSSAYLFPKGSDTIAITYVSDDNGTLEFYNGTQWISVDSTISVSSALVLERKSMVRFNSPDPEFHGVVRLNYTKAAGTVGKRVNATGMGRGPYHVICFIKFPSVAPRIPSLNKKDLALKLKEDDKDNKGFEIGGNLGLKPYPKIKSNIPKDIQNLMEPSGILAYDKMIERANGLKLAVKITLGEDASKDKGKFSIDSKPIASKAYEADLSKRLHFLPALNYHGTVHATIHIGLDLSVDPFLSTPSACLLPSIVQQFVEISFSRNASSPNVRKAFYDTLDKLFKANTLPTREKFLTTISDMEGKATGAAKTDIADAKALWTTAFDHGEKALGRKLAPLSLSLERLSDSVFAYNKSMSTVDLTMTVESVNDAPILTSAVAFLPVFPYNLTVTPYNGVNVGTWIIRPPNPYDKSPVSKTPLAKDVENDTLGVGIVYADVNRIGHYEYRANDSSPWQEVELNNTLVDGEAVGKADVLLLRPEAQLKYVPKDPSMIVWSNKEAREQARMYFVAWDLTDQLATGIHEFHFPVSLNASISSKTGSAFTGRIGCDGKLGSQGRVDECGKCGGDGKWCIACDGVRHSDAVIDDCGNCTGGTTNRTLNFRLDCGGTCGESYLDECEYCQLRSNFKNVSDCTGECFGEAEINKCGHCVVGTTGKPKDFGMDLCGVCGGTNSTCLDCAGIPNGKKVFDMCNKCEDPSDKARYNTGCVKLGALDPVSGDVETSTKITVKGAGLNKYKTAHCEMVCTSSGKIIGLQDVEVNDNQFIVTAGPHPSSVMDLSSGGNKNYNLKCKFNSMNTSYSTVNNFTFYNQSAISITSISINEAEANTGPVNVTIQGSGFPDTGYTKCITDDGFKYHATYIDSSTLRCFIAKRVKSKRFKISPQFGTQDSNLHKEATNFTFFATSPYPVKMGFAKNLQSIIVTMNKAAIHDSKSCDGLFPTASLTKFGNETECVLQTPTKMLIKLSEDASVKPNDNIIFQNGSLKCANEEVTKAATGTQSVSVKGPPIAVIPKTRLMGPNEVGACADIELDASSSFGSGGRDLKFSWYVRWTSDQDMAAIKTEATSDLQAIQSKLSALPPFSPFFDIGKDNVKLNLKYEFLVSVENFLGKKSANASLVVIRKNKQLPTIDAGPTERKVKASRNINLQARPILSPCLNLSVSESKVLFEWEVSNAIGMDFGVMTGPMLRIKAGTLQGGKEYTATVTIKMASDPSLLSSKDIVLKIESSPLIARIAGGTYQVVGATGTLSLDASLSTDPDRSPEKAFYNWECSDASGSPCSVPDPSKPGRKKRLVMKKEAVNNIDIASTLASNAEYTFKMTFKKGSRVASRSVRVKVEAGNPPKVRIKSQIKPKENPTELIFIKAYVESIMDITEIEWICVNEENFGYVDLSRRGVAQTNVKFTIVKEAGTKTARRRFALVLAPNVLEDGVDYKFRVKASHKDATGISETEITTNAPPSKGTLEVNPVNGTALKTKFEVKAIKGWSDDLDDLPLELQYGYITEDNQEEYLNLFGDKTKLEDITFPRGNPSKSNSLTVFVDVMDAYGATTRQTASITVMPFTITTQFLASSKDELFKSLDSGNVGFALGKMGAMLASLSSDSGDAPQGDDVTSFKEAMTEKAVDILKSGGYASDPKAKKSFYKTLRSCTNNGMAMNKNTKNQLATTIVSIETGKSGNKRRRRRATVASPKVEAYTVDQGKTTLSLISNLIDPSKYDADTVKLKSQFLEVTDSTGVKLCAGLVVGMPAAVVDNKLLVLRSEKNPFTTVATTYTDMACSNCSSSLSKSAKILLGTALKSKYSSWNCSGGNNLCSGACLITSQQIYDLLSTSASGDLILTSVVDMKLYNPVTYEALPVASLSSPITYRLPVLNVPVTKETYFECKRWNTGSSSWSTTGCLTNHNLIQDQNTNYIECKCTENGYTAVFKADRPPTTPSHETTVSPLQVRTVQFAFDADYNAIVTSAKKEQLVKAITQAVAVVMKVNESRITNMVLSSGSIIVKFSLLPGSADTESSLNSTVSLLEAAVKGQFKVKLSDGTVLKADPASFIWTVGSDFATAEPTDAEPTESGLTETEVIIIACVCGGIALIALIVIVVVCAKKKKSVKTQISPSSSDQELRRQRQDVEMQDRGRDNAGVQLQSHSNTKF